MQKKWHNPLDKRKKRGIMSARRGNHVENGRAKDGICIISCVFCGKIFSGGKNMKQKIVRIVEKMRSYGILAIGIVRRIIVALQKKLQALEKGLKALVGKLKEKSAG